jgi:hypothetical protein
MNANAFVMGLGLFFAGIGICLAADANLGTWKLNEAKSTLPAGVGKNTTVVYAAVGDQVKVTVDGTDKDGKPAHNEWIGKFDGKPYPVTGDPGADTRTYKKLNDHSLELLVRKDGNLTSSASVIVADDGKSRTVTLDGKDSAGKAFRSIAFYDKQ